MSQITLPTPLPALRRFIFVGGLGINSGWWITWRCPSPAPRFYHCHSLASPWYVHLFLGPLTPHSPLSDLTMTSTFPSFLPTDSSSKDDRYPTGNSLPLKSGDTLWPPWPGLGERTNTVGSRRMPGGASGPAEQGLDILCVASHSLSIGLSMLTVTQQLSHPSSELWRKEEEGERTCRRKQNYLTCEMREICVVSWRPKFIRSLWGWIN